MTHRREKNLSLSKYGSGFTVIELLVVVTVVTMLVTLLLPSLDKARESARRAICMSNLRQNYVGAVSYYTDNKATLPTTSYRYSWGSAATGGHVVSSVYPAGNGIHQSTGWVYFFNAGYLASKGEGCPSMDVPIITATNYPTFIATSFGDTNSMVVSYDYRYNTYDQLSYTEIYGNWQTGDPAYPDHPNDGSPMPSYQYPAKMFDDPISSHRSRPLFCDATEYRLHDNYIVQNYTVRGTWSLKWAHLDGGNFVTMDGSTRWMVNTFNIDTWGPRMWLSWPTFINDTPYVRGAYDQYAGYVDKYTNQLINP